MRFCPRCNGTRTIEVTARSQKPDNVSLDKPMTVWVIPCPSCSFPKKKIDSPNTRANPAGVRTP